VPAFLVEVERRTAVEAGGEAAGVELLTFHRAKGLEWDAVFLPALEEGTLPIRQATEPAELAEERRLLYVGITRARRYLWLSWATSRTAHPAEGGNRPVPRRAVPPPGRPGSGRHPADGGGRASKAIRPSIAPSTALRAWRTAVRADAVAPFIVFHGRSQAIAMTPALDRRAPRVLVGPTKLDRYGEIITASSREADGGRTAAARRPP
jgi:DNA helicase-2/ATP-dependent DNA helicase PcrA